MTTCLAFHSSPNCVNAEADISVVVVNLPSERKWQSHQGVRHSQLDLCMLPYVRVKLGANGNSVGIDAKKENAPVPLLKVLKVT